MNTTDLTGTNPNVTTIDPESYTKVKHWSSLNLFQQTTMPPALVSILIPTYNREHLISETIGSALAQDYEALEVVVVDNASTDNTWEQIQSIASKDPRVKAFRNESNIGPVCNWIECARHAQGVYAKILWSDDLLDPLFLKKTTPYLANADVGFVYTAARIFNKSDNIEEGAVHYNALPTGMHDAQVFVEESLLGTKFPVSPGCVLLRTEDLRRNLWADIPNSVGSIFRNHAIGNDLLLLLLTAQQYKRIAVVCEPLSMFREHAGSISISSGASRLVIHYDLARAFFAQAHVKDRRLLAKFNTQLWWHQRQYEGSKYGVHKVVDFYPQKWNTNISITHLIKKAVQRLVRVG